MDFTRYDRNRMWGLFIYQLVEFIDLTHLENVNIDYEYFTTPEFELPPELKHLRQSTTPLFRLKVARGEFHYRSFFF